METLPPFESVVRTHGATVMRVCLAVVGPSDADDAWSETFLSALRVYPRLDAGANVEAWLVTIAHRKAIDVVRARGRRAIPVDEVPDVGSPAWHGLDPQLWEALAELPFTQRAAVAYHHVMGLPYKEIAAILGNSTEAARRASSDGIARLRADGRVTGRPPDPPGPRRDPARSRGAAPCGGDGAPSSRRRP
ncbi:sigma-70 family RNA polymerase sigma factor [Rhodococcus rhodnii]|uniref:Sigma-70 family RNA polymerase sigma factor n=1 Tax=Rhodococcus rhodnii TaxID=38312 RepID=A0A6P2CDB2_9NOCA|nr:sigma-70 family RNA polymerase sigma factor [Rhodococcus rhodnii]